MHTQRASNACPALHARAIFPARKQQAVHSLDFVSINCSLDESVLPGSYSTSYHFVLIHVYLLGLLSLTQIRNRGLPKISEIRCMLGMKPLREVTNLGIKHVDFKLSMQLNWPSVTIGAN